MINRKFSFISQEFSKLVSGAVVEVNSHQALLCRYKDTELYIEDGSKIKLNDSIILYSPLGETLSPERQVEFNSDFNITRDGYLTNISNLDTCFVRHFVIPEHPQSLVNILSTTVDIVVELKKEMSINVVN